MYEEAQTTETTAARQLNKLATKIFSLNCHCVDHIKFELYCSPYKT